MKKTLKTKKKVNQIKKISVNVLDFFTSAFVVINSEKKIHLANKSFADLVNIDVKDLKGKTLDKYFKADDINKLFSASSKTFDGEGIISSCAGVNTDVSFHAGGLKNYDGKEKLFILHFTKSHKFKKHINALNTGKEILKEKINTKDKELKNANKLLKENNAELIKIEKAMKIIDDEMLIEEEKKSKYINNIIKQYKKPLNYINKIAEILSGTAIIDEDMRVQFIANLENKAKSLQNSINLLYEWENEKIRGASSKIEEIDVKNFLSEIEHYLEDKLNGKILKFDLQKNSNYKILADKRKLKDIIIDILRNAIDYFLNDKILVKITPNQQSDKLSFNIINSGIGVPDEYQLKLFDKYSYLREVNFSPLELNFPIFSDILGSFGADLEVIKQKNKEDLIKIETSLISRGSSAGRAAHS